MNYYPFHIGDYATHTAHLEPLEDLAYRRMLDLYYLREGPLPIDPAEVARLIRMRDQFDAVEAVLREFFLPLDAGWTHERCEEELGRMLEKQAKAKASAEASVNARRAKAERPSNDRSTNAERTLNERSATVELPTPTPTPIPIPKKKSARANFQKPVDVTDVTWQSFLANCRAKQKPPTDLVMLKIRAEAVKAGLSLEDALIFACERSWARFEHEWWQNERNKLGPSGRLINPADVARVTVPDNGAAEETRRRLEERDRNTAPPPADVRARMQELLNHMKVKP